MKGWVKLYKLLKIDEGQMDRFIYLKNLETGVVEYCFDNSMTVSDDNFEFMKIGQNYRCKIVLVGDQMEEPTEHAKKYVVVSKENIGTKVFLKVKVNDNFYYVLANGMNSNNGNVIFFEAFRKDLLEVNGKVNYFYNGLF